MPSHSDSTNPASQQAAGTPAEQVEQLLRQGQAAVRAGQRGPARRLFQRALEADPTGLDAWLWLAYLAPTPRQSLSYLEQAGARHPGHPRLREAIIWAEGRLRRERGGSSTSTGPQWSPARPPSPLPQPQGPSVDAPTRRPAPGKGTEGAQARLWAMAQKAPPKRRFRLRTPVIGLALLVLILGGLAAAIVTHGGLPARAFDPAPTATLEPAAAADMAALREQSGQAIDSQDWAQAVTVLEQMRQASPEDAGVRQQLAVAHLRRGLQLVELDRIDEAIDHYDAAIRFYANDMDLQTARKLAVNYRDGRAAGREHRWDQAIERLEAVYHIDTDFRDVTDLLFSAYMARAEGQEAAQDLPAAREAYAQAVEIKPESEEAQNKLASITATLTPPTPTPTPRPRKRIVVSVAQQHLWAYENDQEVFSFICSTGTVRTPTQFGTYQVLDKIPEAWSSVWSLRMPFWLGIYWAGASEDGIHALPIYSDGRVLWKGNLGHRISYGCIVLDTPDAEALYNWAEIGTSVTVNAE